MAGKLMVNGQEVLEASQNASNVLYKVDPAYATMQDEIDELNDQLNNLVKSDSYTGTTSSSGNLLTNITRVILFAYSVNTTDIVIPFRSTNGIAFHICDNTNMSAKSSKEITVKYFYVENKSI